MGVKELWPLLAPVMSHKTFDDMKGETIAIDLSIWIVDSQCVKQMMGSVTRPHLRNLFFRASALLHADILPVFVIEGDAPELKWQTMAERQQHRSGRRVIEPTARRANRSHFKTVIKECCTMLDYLGVPYVQSCGEAEAMCAALNHCGLVDAVITDDGDAFLYGAKTVYRNFTTTKTPGVDCYHMSDVQSRLGLHRNHLIALALLIGCDYCPKGVPGVGKTQAMNFVSESDAEDILTDIVSWSRHTSQPTLTSSAKLVASKIEKMESFNFTKVIEEFTNNSCRLRDVGVWSRPMIAKAQSFNESKMEWPVNYTLEKMLPLLTLWSLQSVIKLGVKPSQLTIRPERIVKKRVRQGVDCLEVLWAVTDPYEVDETDEKVASLATIERLDMVEKCFPLAVQEFLDEKAAKTKKTKAKTKRTKAKTKPKTKQTANSKGNPSDPLPIVVNGDDLTKQLSLNSVSLRSKKSQPKLPKVLHACGDNFNLHSDHAPSTETTFPDFAQDHGLGEGRSLLDESSDLSVICLDDVGGSVSPANTNSVSCNSIEMLLADISGHLKTPAKVCSASEQHESCDDITNGSKSDSRLSLLSLDDSRCMEGDSGMLVANSTPFQPASCKDSSFKHVTYGEFDLVPQMSALSFTDPE